MKNNCPNCKRGFIFCEPSSGDSFIEICTDCDYTKIRRNVRRNKKEIDFKERRKEENDCI